MHIYRYRVRNRNFIGHKQFIIFRRARPTIWLYMLCRRYFIWIRNIWLMYNYRVYNNLFWIFLIQMDRANRVICISPFYFILLANSTRCRLRGFWSWLIRDPEDIIQWSPENSGINVRSFFLFILNCCRYCSIFL